MPAFVSALTLLDTNRPGCRMGTQWAATSLQQGLVPLTVSQNPGGQADMHGSPLCGRQQGVREVVDVLCGDASAFCRPLIGHSPESLVSREQLLWERQDALWQQEVQRSAPDWH